MKEIEKELSKNLDISNLEKLKLERLSQKELLQMHQLIEPRLEMLEHPNWPILLEKIEQMLEPSGRTLFWESNHAKITATIADFIKVNNRMPNKTEIANLSGLSRKTVYNHFKHISQNELIKEQQEQYQFMVTQVVDNLLQASLKGNVRASIAYLQLMGKINNTGNAVVQNQNNIQLNKTVINQQIIQQLKPEQLQQIEEIIQANLPEPTKQTTTQNTGTLQIGEIVLPKKK